MAVSQFVAGFLGLGYSTVWKETSSWYHPIKTDTRKSWWIKRGVLHNMFCVLKGCFPSCFNSGHMFSIDRDRSPHSRCLSGWKAWKSCENQSVILTSKVHTFTVKPFFLSFFLDVFILFFLFDKLLQLQDIVEEHDAKAVLSDEENFPCYLYPANVVNCSWTFPALQEGSEIFVAIRYF